jgi:hypothetical protein
MQSFKKLYVPLVCDRRLGGFLKTVIRNGSKVSRDPMIISSYKQNEIGIVEFNNEKIIINHPEFNTYGASVNKIWMCLFNRVNTIPLHIKEELQKSTDINYIGKTFGESVEKTLHIHYLINEEEKERNERNNTHLV